MKRKLFPYMMMVYLSLQIFNVHAVKPTESYFTNRIQPSDRRYPTFFNVLEFLTQQQFKTIVETGTSRDGDRNFEGDGGSTIIFADWASHNGATLYSVDISAEAVANAKACTDIYGSDIHIVHEDAIAFLLKFDEPIDFLYLDSFDFDFGNPITSQVHHLKEIVAAYPNLHQKSIVMIDDCDLPEGGKGKLVIEFLTSMGWVILQNGYQVIMIQRG